jgi:monoamine oxidase
LIRAAGTRWAIEECLQTAKNEAGLDHCQVRDYRSWYAHVTLAMPPAVYLAATRTHAAEANPGDNNDPPSSPTAVAVPIAEDCSVPDVAIVGAGPAGIATAYFSRDLGADVIVLEASGDIGGRTLSVPVAGVPSNTGALFIYRRTPAEELATELGIRAVAFTPDTYGIHVNGATIVDSDNDRLIDQLPVSSTAREQLRAFVRASLDEYAQYTKAGELTDNAGALAEATAAERLRGLEPDVSNIITCAIKGGSVADPSQLSAQYALRYFASYLAHEQDNRLYPVDGMQSIPRGMADRLPSPDRSWRTFRNGKMRH